MPTLAETRRLPDETDSVYINVPGKEISISISRQVGELTKRIDVQTLVCNEPLRLFNVDLHADEFFRVISGINQAMVLAQQLFA